MNVPGQPKIYTFCVYWLAVKLIVQILRNILNHTSSFRAKTTQKQILFWTNRINNMKSKILRTQKTRDLYWTQNHLLKLPNTNDIPNLYNVRIAYMNNNSMVLRQNQITNHLVLATYDSCNNFDPKKKQKNKNKTKTKQNRNIQHQINYATSSSLPKKPTKASQRNL